MYSPDALNIVTKVSRLLEAAAEADVPSEATIKTAVMHAKLRNRLWR
jgi:hypothetical protein